MNGPKANVWREAPAWRTIVWRGVTQNDRAPQTDGRTGRLPVGLRQRRLWALDKITEAQPDAAADAAYVRFVEENLPRNYAAHYIHGMLGMTGFRLVNTPTFVPAYLHSLSGSDVWVGLGLSLQQLGGIVSPIFGAAQMEHRKNILPISVALGSAMRLQILGLALSGWLLTGTPALVLALVFLFLLGLFQGPQRVAFQFLLAKVIPTRLRGRLQAWRNLTGGLIAASLSYFAGNWLIASHVLGNGYATTFFIAFVLTSLGLVALNLMMREPQPPTVRARVTFRERLKDFPSLIRDDKGFAWFLVARTLAMGSRIGQPFFFLYAASVLGVSASNDPVEFGKTLAILSFAYMGADTVMNLVWGYLSDRGGFRSTFIISLALNLAAVALLMAAGSFPAIILAFFGIGAAQSAYLMSTTNIVMEFGHRHDVPMRMALSNTAEGVMGALAPLLGGVIAVVWSYQAAFAATLVSVAVALVILVWKVDEPRRRMS
ncbi:MAG: MFS transporter [Alphaproteobacteria bacterium]|nr:MFS transporter [Alphaproteobacteria bacterium]